MKEAEQDTPKMQIIRTLKVAQKPIPIAHSTRNTIEEESQKRIAEAISKFRVVRGPLSNSKRNVFAE